jgi:hypothetical protein
MTEPPYFGTANEPYEPPPDRPYQPPPYEPPADRPYEPPPDRSPVQPPPVQPPPDRPYHPPPDKPYHPPPDKPYHRPPDQPPPDQPEKPRRLRRWLISGLFVLVAIAIASPADVFSFFDFSSNPGNSSDPGKSSDPAYGRSAIDVVHELHICDSPKVDQGITTCTLPDGIGYAVVTTVDDKTEQDDFAAGFKNPAEGCTMVVKGYFVTGPDRATLTQALGNLDAFAANHHGYLEGGCS